MLDSSQILHIIPIDDLHKHICSEFCKCKPKWNDEGIYIHNSFDGREYVERLVDVDNIIQN